MSDSLIVGVPKSRRFTMKHNIRLCFVISWFGNRYRLRYKSSSARRLDFFYINKCDFIVIEIMLLTRLIYTRESRVKVNILCFFHCKIIASRNSSFRRSYIGWTVGANGKDLDGLLRTKSRKLDIKPSTFRVRLHDLQAQMRRPLCRCVYIYDFTCELYARV